MNHLRVKRHLDLYISSLQQIAQNYYSLSLGYHSLNQHLTVLVRSSDYFHLHQQL